MTWLTHLKLGMAVAGIVLWGYGVRADQATLRWTGIGFLATSAVLRFWGAGRRRVRRP